MVGYHGALASAATHDCSPAIWLESPTSGPLAACSSAGVDVDAVARKLLTGVLGPDPEHAASITTAATASATQKHRKPFITPPEPGSDRQCSENCALCAPGAGITHSG